MPRRSVPKRWPTGLIEVAPSTYGYVQGDYLALVRRETRKSYRAGEPAEEAARKLNVGGYYMQWANPERLPLLVERLYTELQGEM